MATGVELELKGGVAVVRVDDPERPVNTLGSETLDAFDRAVGRLERSGGLTGAVIVAARPGVFIAGADLDDLLAVESADEAAALARRGQAILERWAALPFPTAAAIGGAALGGGLEVALACTWRVAADDPAVSLGLPEVQLGLLPALGGTYRLPRRVGLAKGVEMLLTGRRLNARQALAAGLVDELVAPEVLERAAVARLASGARRGWPRPADLLFGRTPFGRRFFFGQARQRAERKSGGHYPAPGAILDAVETGYAQGREAALAAEAERFGELAAGGVARQLVGLFLASRQLAGGPGDELAADSLVGVIGAGFMGSGIAAAAARAGFRVRMVDRDEVALGRGMEFCAGRFESLARRGKLAPEEARAARARVAGGLEPTGLGAAALVVEAVVEEIGVKERVLRELDERAGDDAVLASNTSTIPIAELAAFLERPERMIGLHFFSPVHRMPLVEVIRHPGSSDAAVERGVAFARRLGKTPIVVHDGPGFYTSRTLSPYLAQGGALLLEGAGVKAIDRAARAVGFPVGPMELLDEVGIDVAAHAARTMAAAFPQRMAYPEAFRRMVDEGRRGRKSGKGFYDYSAKAKRPDPAVREVVGAPAEEVEMHAGSMGERLVWAMTAEAVRCLEDGILDRPLEGDVGAVLGLGFPPFRGGPFRFVDAAGSAAAVEILERLAAAHGAVFAVPGLLREMAAAGRSFHGDGHRER